MKRAFSMLLMVISLALSICLIQKQVSAEDGKQVLLIIKERYGSADLQLMETNEAIMMKQTLEAADFKVNIASASGRTFLIKNVTLESDFKLAEVILEDYVGFMITCSGLANNISLDRKQVPAFGEAFSKPEEVVFAKLIVDSGKPVAAQSKAVIILAEAGVLAGKRYSYGDDIQLPGAIYGGQGVVQDGNIITSSFCPFNGQLDQTVEITNALITELQK